jgi:signal transduction histidine kinase
VKACNNDGIWNEKGASVTLIIIPPYWKTWWFQVSAVLFIFLMVTWTVRSVEMRKIREKMLLLEREAALERERTRIARDMHDDLGARLTEIRLLSELSQRTVSDPLTTKSKLREISESARDIVDSFQEIVWSVNPRYDTLDSFADFLTQYASGYLGKAGLRCRLDIPSSVPTIKVSTDIRHNMMMAVKEILNNTVKHAAAAEVTLKLSYEGRHLSVVIRDNGKGFSPDEVRKFGDGLMNMRRRLESVGGEIQIDSRPGNGTTVALSVTVEEPKK